MTKWEFLKLCLFMNGVINGIGDLTTMVFFAGLFNESKLGYITALVITILIRIICFLCGYEILTKLNKKGKYENEK